MKSQNCGIKNQTDKIRLVCKRSKGSQKKPGGEDFNTHKCAINKAAVIT